MWNTPNALNVKRKITWNVNVRKLAKTKINLNVLLIYVTVNIQNVLLWLEGRHEDACAIGQWRRQ